MSQAQPVRSDNIDGFQYEVFMLDPLAAADMLADLSNILAPVIGAATNILATGDVSIRDILDGGIEGIGDQLGMTLQNFFATFPKAKQREFMAQLSAISTVVMPDGATPKLNSVFKAHFRGRTMSMYKWFLFALKAQFSDFFSSVTDATSLSAQDLIK